MARVDAIYRIPWREPFMIGPFRLWSGDGCHDSSLGAPSILWNAELRLFACQHCGQRLYFENTRCERCGHRLGYLPDRTLLSALEPAGEDRWQAQAGADEALRFCANADHDACNWMVAADSSQAFCRACRLNRTIPDLSVPGQNLLWQRYC